MKAKTSLYALTAAALLSLLLLGACTRNPFSARTDAQIAAEVQNKINSDATLTTKQISVGANNGVVTLTGNVANETERLVAANDAAQVDGVKTVVNDLVAGAAASQTTAPATPAQTEPRPVARRATHRAASRPVTTYDDSDTTTRVASAPAPAPVSMTTAAPAAPRPVTIQDGTTISIRMVDGVDSATNQVGDVFHATLDTPLMDGDQVVVPSGADVQGRVAEAKNAGHFAGKPQIALELTKLIVNGKTYPLHTNQYTREGTSRGKNTAEKVGAGAAIGAIIGGIAGGGKGAAIGAAAGGGLGGGVQAATKPPHIKVDPEALLTFQLESPLTVTPVPSLERDTNRHRLEDDSNRP